MDSPWPRIDGWLGAHAPRVARQLRRGAAPETIARVDVAAGHALPSDVREAYLFHDGAAGDATTVFGAVRCSSKEHAWVRGMSWLRIEHVLRELAWTREQSLDARTGPAKRGDRGDFVPLAKDAGDNLLLVAPRDGALYLWDHETWSPERVAPSLGAWMSELADDLEANLVAEDEDDGEPVLLLLPAPRIPALQPRIERTRAASVFLEVVTSRRLVELDPRALTTPDAASRPLLLALTDALAKRGPKACLRAVLQVLEESPDVLEIYGEDSMIGAVIDEVV